MSNPTAKASIYCNQCGHPMTQQARQLPIGMFVEMGQYNEETGAFQVEVEIPLFECPECESAVPDTLEKYGIDKTTIQETYDKEQDHE